MKAKLGADISPHVILGACNPPLALRAITVEPSVGLLLPCNVVVRALDDDHTIVEAIDPQIMVQATDNASLAGVADEAGAKLSAALEQLAGTPAPS